MSSEAKYGPGGRLATLLQAGWFANKGISSSSAAGEAVTIDHQPYKLLPLAKSPPCPPARHSAQWADKTLKIHNLLQ